MSLLSARMRNAIDNYRRNDCERVSFGELMQTAHDYMTDKLLQSKLERSGYRVIAVDYKKFVDLLSKSNSCRLPLTPTQLLFEADK